MIGNEGSVRLYNDLVHEYPEMAICWADILPSIADAAERLQVIDGDHHTPDTDSQSSPITGTQPSLVASTTDTDTPTASPASTLLASTRTYSPPRYICAECGHPFDRAQRARDCANKDLGLSWYN